MTGNVLAVVIGYLLGSVPVGLVLGRTARGVDIREYGSGKIGTANVLRSLGLKAGLATLLLDMGKGVGAVFVAQELGDARYVEALAAAAAVAGHNWSVFIRFSGGRGVSAGLGGLIAMAPPWGAGALGIGLAVIAASRYVSLGSMSGALFAAISMVALAAAGRQPWEYATYAAAVTGVILFQHRDNVRRLLRGEERRLGQRAERVVPPSTGPSTDGKGTAGLSLGPISTGGRGERRRKG